MLLIAEEIRKNIFYREALSAVVTTCSQVCMPCSHRCQCWFQDDWLAGLKSLLFTSLRADYGHNVNTGFWRVHTSVTAPYLWPEAGEVKGQPRSSQWAWRNLHSPSCNCLLQWMYVHRNSSTDSGFCYRRYTARWCAPVWNHSSRSVHKVAAGRLKTMTLLGFDTDRSLSVYKNVWKKLSKWRCVCWCGFIQKIKLRLIFYIDHFV